MVEIKSNYSNKPIQSQFLKYSKIESCGNKLLDI